MFTLKTYHPLVLLVTVLFMTSLPSFSQEKSKKESGEEITIDRPEETKLPNVPEKGTFQFETGFQSEFRKEKIEDVELRNTAFNKTTLKYSVVDMMAVMVTAKYITDKITTINTDKSVQSKKSFSGLGPMAVGLKIAFPEIEPKSLTAGILTELTLPYLGSDYYKPKYILPRAKLLVSQKLPGRILLSTNLGAEYDNSLNEIRGLYSASIQLPLINGLTVFAESYGFIGKYKAAESKVDGGFKYKIKKNIRIDCSGGLNLNKKTPDYFLSIGLCILSPINK